MLTEKRHQAILEALEKQNIVQMQELVNKLGVSESTIRRDLSILEDEGQLTRVHGGAKRNFMIEAEPNVQEKSVRFAHDKKAIAKQAASLVEDGDVIYIDAGTTTLAMIPYLVGKKLTVVTNGIQHAALLSELGIDPILIGGKLKAGTQAIIGATAVKQLHNYRFRKAFLGMNGVDLHMGFTTPDEEEATMKETAVELSSQSYILIDASKFSKVSFCQVASLKDATIITYQLDSSKETRYQIETALINIKEEEA
ncbi:DeoR/GlpR family DNA-binding transcription regulator [Granulicatella seriolae]|uniref:DeoR family transcriptional regulator n=1 Tax=Granulicatella seriolae TaxID=2967226 RepID=A0ABT1WQ97_9LACT|nr:DeoR/GlpR family DNA-binding transcription regulator [Granulicatella seriolae]